MFVNLSVPGWVIISSVKSDSVYSRILVNANLPANTGLVSVEKTLNINENKV